MDISPQDAADICAAMWNSQEAAEKQAALLRADGWDVRGHPVKIATTLSWRIAAVYDPRNGRYVGDIRYLRR